MKTPVASTPLTLHASCVSWRGKAVLITGASGSGKSSLALQLMALGAILIADDQTVLTRKGDALIANCPMPLKGLIEARHIGILNAETETDAKLHSVISMDDRQTDRLPPLLEISMLGVALPLLHCTKTPTFPAAILQYLKGGRHA